MYIFSNPQAASSDASLLFSFANGQFSQCENPCTLFQLKLVKKHMFLSLYATGENLRKILVRT